MGHNRGDNLIQITMNMQEFNSRDCEILRTIPKSELNDFIEKNGRKLRELLS
jgi:hypothetical protein